MKASWGKSFKAPKLFQRFSSKNASLDAPPSRFGGTGYDDDATVLSTSGGNRNLDPERARSWTAALAFHPEAIPGLEAELTWFDIDYTDRVVRPFSNTGEALSNAISAEFVVRSEEHTYELQSLMRTSSADFCLQKKKNI